MTRWFSSAAFVGSAVLVLLVTAPGLQARQDRVLTPEPVANVAHTPDQFAGLWDYNAEESVNAATGRPEQNPRSATQRGGARVGGAGAGATGRGGGRGGGGGAGSGVPPSGGGPEGVGVYGGGNAYGGGGRGGGGGLNVGMSAAMMQESRDLSRDLLEVAETLAIKVSDGGVTFTDDLERERTYSTDGSKGKYRLGASQFEAKTTWDGSQLKKEIQGAYDFHMSETYFLSPDGQRLFVIIRLGDGKKIRGKEPPVVGANRVYDRVAP